MLGQNHYTETKKSKVDWGVSLPSWKTYLCKNLKIMLTWLLESPLHNWHNCNKCNKLYMNKLKPTGFYQTLPVNSSCSFTVVKFAKNFIHSITWYIYLNPCSVKIPASNAGMIRAQTDSLWNNCMIHKWSLILKKTSNNSYLILKLQEVINKFTSPYYIMTVWSKWVARIDKLISLIRTFSWIRHNTEFSSLINKKMCNNLKGELQITYWKFKS